MGVNLKPRCLHLPIFFGLITAAVSVFGQASPGASDAPIGTEGGRAIHESVMFDKLGNRNSDVVYRMEFSIQSGIPVFEGASSLGTRYSLSDGTNILRSRVSNSDAFVSQIFEHRNAGKTIVLVPAVYTDLDRSYEKFLIFHDLATRNPDKSVRVLLEGVDSRSKLIDEFFELRAHAQEIDYYHIVSDRFAYYMDIDSHRAAVSPSMALFYENTEVVLQGLEESQELAASLTARRGEKNEQIVIENERIKAELSAATSEFFTAQVYKLVADLEYTISTAVEEVGKLDSDAVEKINELQLKLAKVMLDQGFSGQVYGGYDQDVRMLLADIDRVSSAGTVEVYEVFARTVSAARAVAADVEAASLQRIDYASLDDAVQKEILSRTSLAISETFSDLPEDTLAICELSADRIDEQILLCIKKADYNLVLYNLPYRESNLDHIRHAQDPAEHRIAPGLVFPVLDLPEMHLPHGFSRASDTDQLIGELLNRKLAIFHRAYRESDALLDSDRVLVHYFGVPDTGGMVRISSIDDGEISDLYYIVPGSDLEDQSQNFHEIYEDEDIPDASRMILDKWTQMIAAFIGL